MSKLLREDDYLKLQLIELVRNKGYSIAGAARELDVGVRSAQEFVNRDKKWAKEWMDAYEAMQLEGGIVVGIDLGSAEDLAAESVWRSNYDSPIPDYTNSLVWKRFVGIVSDSTGVDVHHLPPNALFTGSTSLDSLDILEAVMALELAYRVELEAEAAKSQNLFQLFKWVMLAIAESKTRNEIAAKLPKFTTTWNGATVDSSNLGVIVPRPKYKPEDVAFKHGVSKPKILILDIETAPILANVWALFKQNVGLNMIAQDWYILSWSAKWVGSDEVMYQDKRNSWNDSDDSSLLQDIWNLIDQADWIITQNGVKFDMKKLNARFVMNGMKPPSSYKNIDTLLIAKEHFGFTSNKLEYMTDKLCKRYKKLKHGKFAGFELWKECLLGNMDAWDEMELYNKYDVLSLEELYTILRPWYKKHPNPNLYHDSTAIHCSCGSKELEASGFYFTGASKFVKLRCNDCGAEVRDRVNLFSKDKRMSLTMNLG